jgi:hypothetical protein
MIRSIGVKPIEERIADWMSMRAYGVLLARAREALGSTRLLSTGGKIERSNRVGVDVGWITLMMLLPPAESNGLGWDICPWSTVGCRAACYGVASGRMNQGAAAIEARQFNWDKTAVSRAMLRRLKLFMEDRPAFRVALVHEIQRHVVRADKRGLRPAIRLNGTSDIVWERVFPQVFEMFGEVQAYDYTKAPLSARRDLPANYHLTFSYAADQPDIETRAAEWVAAGRNVAVVFGVEMGEDLPAEYLGRRVINADLTDMRFLDPPDVIAGLHMLGGARHDDTGFVARLPLVVGKA